MTRRTSFVIDTNAETLEAAAHPDGVLRGLAARRAFTSITRIQATCRGYNLRRKLVPKLEPIPQSIPSNADIPPSSTVTPPSDDSALVTINPPPAIHEGPEHTLVYLAIQIKSTKKDTALLQRQITNVETEINHREARVNTLQLLVTSLQSSIPSDYVPARAVETLQEQVDDQARELEGWIAREAARKGKLIQLRAQAHAKAKLQAQWHRSRSTMPDHWSLEAEQMMRESAARAAIYLAAASRERHKVPNTLPRDTTSKTRIQLNRSRSPYAPVKKPRSRTPSQQSRNTGPSGVKRATRVTGPPPSAFPSDSGLQNEIPLGDDAKAMFNPKRRTRPVSVVVPEQNRESMNSRLADFYAPRLSPNPKSPTPPVEVVKKAQSTPPSTLVFDDISNSVFGDIDTKLDLDLKIPALPMQRSSSTPPPGSPPAAAAVKPSPPAEHRPALPSPLGRRLSKRANRYSSPPIRTTPPPMLAPLSLPPSEPIRIPPAKTSPAKATASRLSPFRSSFPRLSSTPAAARPVRLPSPSSSTPPKSEKKVPIASNLPIPDWLNDVLTPLQTPRRSPTSGNYTELVLDLRVPSDAPTPTTPPADRDEWDLVTTSPFADRESFQISSQEPAPAPTSTPSGTKSSGNNGMENPRISKLRNRASYILPRPRRSSTRPQVVKPSKSEVDLNRTTTHSVAPPHNLAPPTPNEAKASSSGSKWKKRLSLAAVLPHRSS